MDIKTKIKILLRSLALTAAVMLPAWALAADIKNEKITANN